MDKIMIVGGYEFLSFYLCTALLEKGNSVDCIHINQKEDVFLEEKRFLVGRNANFFETPLAQWADSPFFQADKTVIIISLFDLFLKKDAEISIAQIEASLEKVYATQKEGLQRSTILYILPLQLMDSEEISEPFLNPLQKMKEWQIPYKSIYLPTLFGPWQPFDYLFQQVLLTDAREMKDFHLNEKESMLDAIFVEDAAGEIVRLIEEDSICTCFLKSIETDQWVKCAEYLNINADHYSTKKKNAKNPADILCKEIRASIDYQQGLNLQRQQLMRLLSEV
ncbi:hypothetical protein [Neobacillus sp. LXY-4]|uniref:hypothetical protein n=1 Tax=Neobacillus sp. LXY-4 TaxID=3379826 RepID=UPI003EE01DD1